MTYACQAGEILPEYSNFENDLLDYIARNLEQGNGSVQLNSMLLGLPEAIGAIYEPRAAGKIVILNGISLPVENQGEKAEFRALQ